MLLAIRILLTMMVIMIGATDAMAIEEAAYQVVKKEDRFEVRDYAPHILAETIVEGEMKEAGNMAFRRLFNYIVRRQSFAGQGSNDSACIPGA